MRLLTDISFYGEHPDFIQMAKHADGTILRAGQGGWIDRVFKANAKASGGHLPRGAYWFYDGRFKPVNQVDLLLDAIDGVILELPIFGDYERSYGGPYDGWKGYYDFMRILGDALPDQRLGVYTGYYYWREMVPESAHSLFADYYLWEANYNKLEWVKIPKPWTKMDMWQYSEQGDGIKFGLDPLVKKAIDLNQFMGDDAAWAEFGGDIVTPLPDVPPVVDEPVEPPIELPSQWKGEVTSWSGVNLRKEPTTNSDKVGAIWRGKELEGELVLDGDDLWLKQTLYSAVRYNGKTLISGLEPVESTTGREDWAPDPNRPDRLFYARDNGYRKVVVELDDSELGWFSPQSSIFIGDRIDGDRLHVLTVNGDDMKGWIDLSHEDMIWSEIPQKVLDSPIPPKIKEPEIFRYIEAPSDGVYRQFVWDFHKEDHSEPQPHTVNLFKDVPAKGQYGWATLTEKWQWFLFDLMKLDAPGQSIVFYISAYASMVADNRAMTDLNEKDSWTDWILGRNLVLAVGYKWKWSITMRGNLAKQLSENGRDIMLDGLDLSQDPPLAESVYDKPWLIHKANSAYPNTRENILSNGFIKTTHFPQIKQIINGKREKTGTSYPFFKVPHPVDRVSAKLEIMPSGERRTIVNLSRWLKE